MKTCIVTVYNSENCGSILQAFALGEALRGLGHEVTYLERDIRGTGASLTGVMKVMAKAVATGNFGNVPLKWKFHRQCVQDRARFDVLPAERAAEADCFLLGSDTIWELDSDYFRSRMPRYWGLSLPHGKPRIAYAPSVNGTKPETILGDSRVCGALEAMQGLSVRDGYSREIIRRACGREPALVCDPTMLHTPDFYRAVQRDCGQSGFILLYAFRSFCTPEQIRQIRRYADRQGKKLVSFGVHRKWCDLSVPFDAFAMPAYFDRADAVITNTFHGTVFSLLYHKPFADFAAGSRKVEELLRQFGMESRLAAPGADAAQILSLPVDADALEAKIAAVRSASMDYLTHQLGEVPQ